MSIPFWVGGGLAIYGHLMPEIEGKLTAICFSIVFACSVVYTMYLIASIIKFVKVDKVNQRLRALTIVYGVIMTIYLIFGEAYMVLVIDDYFHEG